MTTEVTTRAEVRGLLDRPLLAGTRITGWTLATAAVVVLILFTRLYALDTRGYSHDESIHAWESWRVLTGQGYRHNPVYHGPFLYHYTALLFALFGHSDLTARLGTSLLGVGISLMPLFMAPWLGKKGVFFAILFSALSPVMMHRSRFIRHDHGAILFNLILFVAMLRYLSFRNKRDLYLSAAMISLSLAGKETTFITFFIHGTFLFGYWAYHWLHDRTRTWREMVSLPSFDLMVVMGTLILPFATAFPIALLGGDPADYQIGVVWKSLVLLAMVAIGALIGVLWNWRRWLVCAAIFWALFLPLFTSLFTNPVEGFATGVVGQLGYWLSQHDVARGGQPWFYYLLLMPMYDYLPLLVGLGGALMFGAGRWRDRTGHQLGTPALPRTPFVLLLIYWLVMAFVVYSWAGEKMPWLTMHLSAPLHLLAGWAMGRLLDADWATIRERGGLWLLLTVPLFLFLLVRLATASPSVGTTVLQQSRLMGAVVILIAMGAAAYLVVPVLARLSGRDGLRMVALSVLILLAGLTVRTAWMASFTNASYATEFLVYAHGTPDTVLVTRELEEMSRRLYGDLSMQVAYDNQSSWPFVWYLRVFPNHQYFGTSPGAPFEAEAVIVGPDNEAAIRPLLGNRYYRRQYRLIWWPNQEWYWSWTPQSLWANLRDPVWRQQAVDILFWRRHPRSSQNWYLVQSFSLYVRRDVAAQLWDYGPEALAAGEALPGDEYLELWETRAAEQVLGAAGSQAGQLLRPKGLAVGVDGRLYVADSGNHRIQIYDAEGTPLRAIGREGDGTGEFLEPWGVAVSPEGLIYVADTWNHRIQVFDDDGAFVRAWGGFGAADAQGPGDAFYGPRGVAVDMEGNLFVADTGNKRVLKYTADGRLLAATGGFGDGPGELQEPVGVAVGTRGEVYVADTWNRRVQVFSNDLEYLREWPVHGWGGVSVGNKPYLATDAQGQVYATDPESHRVLQFGEGGELQAAWGTFGIDLSAMNLPTGVAVGPTGRVYVADSENHRVLAFSQP